jgi:hypothetical protein
MPLESLIRREAHRRCDGKLHTVTPHIPDGWGNTYEFVEIFSFYLGWLSGLC